MKATITLGDYIIKEYGEDFFKEIWSDKNELDLFTVGYKSRKKIWTKCRNHLHEDEYRHIGNATLRGFKCRQCSIIEEHNKQRMDLTGQRFGKWTVVRLDKETHYRDGKKRSTYWYCDCDCGTKHISVSRDSLLKGTSRSCGCNRFENSGENHYNWKGGITPEEIKIRNSKGYAKWRDAVFERDNYTCQCCGQYGKKLNAHHIENFSNNDELRLDVNNGITLCEKCHSFKYPNSFHSIYGVKNNNRQQLEEYIRNYNLKTS